MAPEGRGPFPAAVLLHGCDSLGPIVRRSLRDHARHLVQACFVTLIFDSPAPERFRIHGSTGQDAVAASHRRTHDAGDALRFLRSQPNVDCQHNFLMEECCEAL